MLLLLVAAAAVAVAVKTLISPAVTAVAAAPVAPASSRRFQPPLWVPVTLLLLLVLAVLAVLLLLQRLTLVRLAVPGGFVGSETSICPVVRLALADQLRPRARLAGKHTQFLLRLLLLAAPVWEVTSSVA